ncbi:phage portal protein [Campylobacter majalis]|uniref:phage portal protein n=1 Tax=Campylobacter majalis TaxID=2790656 RepID=UPI003D6880E8
MKKQQLKQAQISQATAKALIKPIKTKLNFFKYPSLEPNRINSYEIHQLLKNSDLDKVSQRLRNQARSISTSVSLTSGFFEMLCSEIYGEQGFILDVTTHKKTLNQTIQKAFFKWEDECCKYGVYDFGDYEELILTALYRDGEAFIRLSKGDSLKIELIDADDITNDLMDEKRSIYYGIAYEKNQITPKTYHQQLKDKTYRLIPAKEIIHIKKTALMKQKRGVSKLASAIFDAHSKDKLKKSELDRARLASEITGFLVHKDENSLMPSVEYSENGEIEQKEINIPNVLQTGTFELLEDGITPHFVNPHNPINMEFFLKSTDRDVARSLGVSYSTYTGDLSDVNYSSIRQGTIAERRNFKRIQNFIKRKFHNVIFKAWLECELLAGRIKPKDYILISENFNFKAQGWEYIDPVKEVNANKIAIQAGFKTISEVLREKGVEIDDFMDELEKEKELVKKLREIKILKGEINEH